MHKQFALFSSLSLLALTLSYAASDSTSDHLDRAWSTIVNPETAEVIDISFASYDFPGLNGVESYSLDQIASIVDETHQKGGKVRLSFGGPSSDSHRFISQTKGWPKNAKMLAKYVAHVVNTHEFDAVDFDIQDLQPANATKEQFARQMLVFLEAVRAHLPDKSISITIPGQQWDTYWMILAQLSAKKEGLVDYITFHETDLHVTRKASLADQIKADVLTYTGELNTSPGLNRSPGWAIPADKVQIGLSSEGQDGHFSLTEKEMDSLAYFVVDHGLHGMMICDDEGQPTQVVNEEKPAPSYLSGEPLKEGDLPKGYNAPSSIAIKRTDGTWRPDCFVELSFLYYFVSEDGLDFAESAAFSPDFVVLAPTNSRILLQNFDYQPGFKVALGTNLWEWNLAAEYTWIRQFNSFNRSAPNPEPDIGIGVWYIDDWFLLGIPNLGQSLPATKVHSQWHLSMDFADLMLSRPYYLGRTLTVAPSLGLRGAWIRQKVNVKIDVPFLNLGENQLSQVSSRNSSHSWAVGPRAGLDAYLLLPMGFRLQGDLFGSLLFTEFTKVSHWEQLVHPDNIPPVIAVKMTDYACLRPNAEIGVGVGWGSYFCKEKFHFDFSANYDFNVFWNQNMIKKLLDESALGSSASPSNLYLHGLNLTARFDF